MDISAEERLGSERLNNNVVIDNLNLSGVEGERKRLKLDKVLVERRVGGALMENFLRELEIVNVEFRNVLNNRDVLVDLDLPSELIGLLEDGVVNRDVPGVLEVRVVSELILSEGSHVGVSVSGRVGQVVDLLFLLDRLSRFSRLSGLDLLGWLSCLSRLDRSRGGCRNRCWGRGRLLRSGSGSRSRLRSGGWLGRSGSHILLRNTRSGVGVGRSGLRARSGRSGSHLSRSRSHWCLRSDRSSRSLVNVGHMMVLSSVLDLVRDRVWLLFSIISISSLEVSSMNFVTFFLFVVSFKLLNGGRWLGRLSRSNGRLGRSNDVLWLGDLLSGVVGGSWVLVDVDSLEAFDL